MPEDMCVMMPDDLVDVLGNMSRNIERFNLDGAGKYLNYTAMKKLWVSDGLQRLL